MPWPAIVRCDVLTIHSPFGAAAWQKKKAAAEVTPTVAFLDFRGPGILGSPAVLSPVSGLRTLSFAPTPFGVFALSYAYSVGIIG